MDRFGYKPVFDAAVEKAKEAKVDHSKFREFLDLYHFIIAPKHLLSPDIDSLTKANAINPILFKSLYDKGPSKAGGVVASELDAIESRHILMMTYLASKIGMDWGNVVEIGGGYGNCLRLIDGIVDYTTWSIIDLPHIIDLQKWFLAAEGVDLWNTYFISSDDPKLDRIPNVIIGAHSLSEFSLQDFIGYMPLVRRSKWLFYVTHNSKPAPELLTEKRDIIYRDFYMVDSLQYEWDSSTMYLFRNLNDQTP